MWITDVVLTIVILLETLLVAYLEREHRLERAKLLNALLSKKPEDMVNMTLADQTKIEVPKVDNNPTDDLIDINEASDEEFNRYVGVPAKK